VITGTGIFFGIVTFLAIAVVTPLLNPTSFFVGGIIGFFVQGVRGWMLGAIAILTLRIVETTIIVWKFGQDNFFVVFGSNSNLILQVLGIVSIPYAGAVHAFIGQRIAAFVARIRKVTP
jgi:hypothetical protein